MSRDLSRVDVHHHAPNTFLNVFGGTASAREASAGRSGPCCPWNTEMTRKQLSGGLALTRSGVSWRDGNLGLEPGNGLEEQLIDGLDRSP